MQNNKSMEIEKNYFSYNMEPTGFGQKLVSTEKSQVHQLWYLISTHVELSLSICIEEMVNTVAAVVREDYRITVRQLAQALDISKLSVYTILRKKLKMRRVKAYRVPHFLTREQRDQCIKIYRESLKIIEDEPGCDEMCNDRR